MILRRLVPIVGLLFFASVASVHAQADNSTDAAWADFALTVQEVLGNVIDGTASKQSEPPVAVTPVPDKPFRLPLVPGDYKELEKLLKKVRDLMKDWPWKRILEKYDRDGDGTLSPDELREFFKDRVPCIPLVLPCSERDKIIEDALCYFLRGKIDGCDLEGIEISPDTIEDWIKRWLESVEWQVQFFCEEHPNPERCEFFRNLKKLFEELREKFREGVPCPPAVGGCDCGCDLSCPCQQTPVAMPDAGPLSGEGGPLWQ